MNVGAGTGLIVGGVSLALLVVFAMWRRPPPPLTFGLLAAAGAAVGAGALLVQDHAGRGDWLITVGVLGVLAPVHARVVFGYPGRRVVAEEPPAA